MKTLLQFFTWWNGSTWGTRFHLWRKGTHVGEDENGNVYYQVKSGKRHVQYANYADASAIPPGWHGWMHYRTDVVPSNETYEMRDWEKGHRSNMTGTPGAYYPKGSQSNPQSRPTVSGDYDAWTP